MHPRGGSRHLYSDVANVVGWANNGDMWCVGTHTNECVCGAQLAKHVQYLCIHACGCSHHSRSDVVACRTGHMCATTRSCWALRLVHPLSSATPLEHGLTQVHTCVPCLRTWAYLTVSMCAHAGPLVSSPGWAWARAVVITMSVPAQVWMHVRV